MIFEDTPTPVLPLRAATPPPPPPLHPPSYKEVVVTCAGSTPLPPSYRCTLGDNGQTYRDTVSSHALFEFCKSSLVRFLKANAKKVIRVSDTWMDTVQYISYPEPLDEVSDDNRERNRGNVAAPSARRSPIHHTPSSVKTTPPPQPISKPPRLSNSTTPQALALLASDFISKLSVTVGNLHSLAVDRVPSGCFVFEQPNNATLAKLDCHSAAAAPRVPAANTRPHPIDSPSREPLTSAQQQQQPAAADGGGGVVLRQNTPYDSMQRTEVIPSGLNPADRIMVISYEVAYPITFTVDDQGKDPSLKMGGVFMDLSPVLIGSLIAFLTNIQVERVEMFLHNQGRCALYLRDPQREGPQLVKALDRQLWLGPTAALYAMTPAAAVCLADYVTRIRSTSGQKSQHWPRHLLTVEKWVPRCELTRKASSSSTTTTSSYSSTPARELW